MKVLEIKNSRKFFHYCMLEDRNGNLTVSVQNRYLV